MRLERERREAANAGLDQRAQNIDREIAGLIVQLTQAIEERDQLKAQYDAMAKEAGV